MRFGKQSVEFTLVSAIILYIWMISCCHPTLCQFLCSDSVCKRHHHLEPCAFTLSSPLKIHLFSKGEYAIATTLPGGEVWAFTLNSWIHLPDPDDCKNAVPASSPLTILYKVQWSCSIWGLGGNNTIKQNSALISIKSSNRRWMQN